MHVAKTDMLHGVDGNAVKVALRQYCEKHPLDEFNKAASNIALQLGERAGSFNPKKKK
jgi:hypothetical protein